MEEKKEVKCSCLCSGKEEKKRAIANALFENLLFSVIIFLGALMISFYSTKYAFLYVVFNFVMLVFVLRKHLCTNCDSFGEWCHCGWGKLAKFLGYKKNSGNKTIGGILAIVTWVVIMGLPIIVFARNFFGIENAEEFLFEAAFFISFLGLVIANLVLHYKNCWGCSMRKKGCWLSFVAIEAMIFSILKK